MRTQHLDNLVSPIAEQIMLLASVESEECGEIKEGTIDDASGKHRIFIGDLIRRFVTGGSYADSFGEQWNRYPIISDRQRE